MPTYRVFGGVLDSMVAIDGLPEIESTSATWRFSVASIGDARSSWDSEVLIGDDVVSDALTISLSRTASGNLRLRYSTYGLGCFTISSDGADITWQPDENPRFDALRWVLLGRVMATAMYQAGTVCLHGSAISMSGRGVCFLAPKRHGKSTLAAALVASGAQLVSDDVVPIDLGPPVTMRPGLPVLRLHEDSEGAIAMDHVALRRTGDDVGKARIDLVSSDVFVPDAQPLDAIYLLRPIVRDDHGSAAAASVVDRVRLDALRALQLLIPEASVATLLSPAESPLLLKGAAAIVRTVPVYELHFARDLELLPEVVRTIRAWHARGVDTPPDAR